jgi:hypothetical protein
MGKADLKVSKTIPLSDLPEVVPGCLEFSEKQMMNLTFDQDQKYLLTQVTPGLALVLLASKDKTSQRKKDKYELYYDAHPIKLASYIQLRQQPQRYYVQLLQNSPNLPKRTAYIVDKSKWGFSW